MSKNSPPKPVVAPPADPDAHRPTLIAFSMHKSGGKWHAFAMETRGTKVLREKVLESDDSRAVVMDAYDKAWRGWVKYDSNPFYEGEK